MYITGALLPAAVVSDDAGAEAAAAPVAVAFARMATATTTTARASIAVNCTLSLRAERSLLSWWMEMS
jgi:hypothetical protein